MLMLLRHFFFMLLNFKDTQNKDRSHNTSVPPHLYLFVAGGELPLLEDHDMVADPLEQESHQLVVLLPAQLQLLQPTQQKR